MTDKNQEHLDRLRRQVLLGRLLALPLVPLKIAWAIYCGTGVFRGVCPRCGKTVEVPRGKIGILQLWGQKTTWCPHCGTQGDAQQVAVRRTRWI